MGNEAIGLGLVQFGCRVAAAYPGTPSSEVLPAVVRFARQLQQPTYSEWSVNERVAAETAIAAAWAGRRAACIMKQVGLNVASDPVMSAAYTGVRAGLVLVVADDPGPHSSQTEQDTRLFGLFAKIPVLDPSSPEEARRMVGTAFEISERHQLPVILRLTTRIAHGREGVEVVLPEPVPRFEEAEPEDGKQQRVLPRDPGRWAATPRHRYSLHVQLVEKLRTIAEEAAASSDNLRSGPECAPLGIIAAGHAFAVTSDLLRLLGCSESLPMLRVAMPHPLPLALVQDFQARCERLLVLEDCDATIELQLPDRRRVHGRLDGTVPAAGELDPEALLAVLLAALERADLPHERPPQPLQALMEQVSSPPVKPPTLCPGCGHRTTFYALRRAFPKNTIFTGDIGCYTLGISLRAVDTVLAMGAAVGMASGFYRVLAQEGRQDPVVGTIGDSTFLHAGIPGLLNAVYVDSRFVLVILDNGTTAMTGGQPTPATGIRADGTMGKQVSIRALVDACGVQFVREIDARDVRGIRAVARQALEYTRQPDGGPAVIIARYPCLVANRGLPPEDRQRVEVNERCNGCELCVTDFQCPALSMDERQEVVLIDRMLCVDCGACLQVCARKAFVPVDPEGGAK